MGAGPVHIVLSGAPHGKGRPRFVRSTGHAFTPADTRKYESALRLAAQDAMGERPPIDGPVIVTVVAVFPIPASWSAKKRTAALRCEIWPTIKPDVDNLIKTLDALNEIVFRDDRQIVDARIVKRYGDKPRLVIEVRAFEFFSTSPSPVVTGGDASGPGQSGLELPAGPGRSPLLEATT